MINFIQQKQFFEWKYKCYLVFLSIHMFILKLSVSSFTSNFFLIPYGQVACEIIFNMLCQISVLRECGPLNT